MTNFCELPLYSLLSTLINLTRVIYFSRQNSWRENEPSPKVIKLHYDPSRHYPP